MSNSENIVRFNRVVLVTLTRLHECFPKPTELNLANFAGDVWGEDESEDELWKLLETIRDTIEWLRDEGFVRYRNQDDKGDFYGLRLSLRGLVILGAVPKSLKGTKSLVDRAKDVLAKGSEKAASELVNIILVAIAGRGG